MNLNSGFFNKPESQYFYLKSITMIALSEFEYLTPEAYLEFESQSPIKHEYINGQAYAMAGTTDIHNTIALNLATILRSQLRGTDYRVYFADLKLRIEQRNCFYYPDLLITCDRRDRETATYKRFPKLIIEVLSDSTEARDRGDKFNDYQTLETLETYILVNTKTPRVEVFERQQTGGWHFRTYTSTEESFTLKTLNLTIAWADLYEDVNLELEVNKLPNRED